MASTVTNLNVGGTIYTTTLETLQFDNKSLIGECFLNKSKQLPRDKDGNFFVDRDGPIFRHILNYLRLKKSGQRWEAALPNQPDQLAALAEESEYYQLPELREKAIQLLTTCGLSGGDKMSMSTFFENVATGGQQMDSEYYRQPIYIPSEISRDDLANS